jgi:hypothetical protein
MKTAPSLRSILAGIGAGSLLIYVLACSTSFSPDDRQVLYPAYDPQSDSTCVALYDRKTGKSEILYTAAMLEEGTNRHPALIRAEWLPDGKHILVGQNAENSGLFLTILPRGVKEPVRQFQACDAEHSAVSLEFPFAVSGDELWLNAEKSEPLRINLTTGKIAGGEKSTNPIVVLPAPDGKHLVGMRGLENGKAMEIGAFEPESMTFKPVATLPENSSDEGASDGTLPALNPKTGQVCFIGGERGKPELRVLKAGKLEFSRALSHPAGELFAGPFLDWAPDGKTIFTAYCASSESKTNAEYGLVEIPLNDAPLRFTPLFHAKKSDQGELLFAQPSLSHDGKAWAIATSYLYRQNESLAPDDSALFLVDLSKSKRMVTKIPIPVPPERKELL